MTIRDASGRTLADLIVGARAGDGGADNRRFVRLASSDRAYRTTFQTRLATALSIDLTDWIDTDLLRVSAGAITQIRLDAYTIDEARGQRVEGERFMLSRDGQNGAWTIGPDGEPAAPQAAALLAEAIAGLRIVGVEPKPRKLARLLAGEEADAAFDTNDLLRMQRSGFFLSPEGRLIANAGELRFRTTQGLEYTLWFGEILARTNTGGAIFDTEAGPRIVDAIPSSRALLVTVDVVDPDDEQARAVSLELSKKYADWWYLIDEASFGRLRPKRSELTPIAGDDFPTQLDPPGQPE